MSLDKARADLANLEQAIAKLRAKITEVEDQAKKVRIYIEMAEVYDGSAAPFTHSGAETGYAFHTKHTRLRDGIVERARKAAAEILREKKAPVPTRDLLSLLMNQGIEIGGSQPNSNLSGMLSKSPDFVNGRGGWHLAEWDNLPNNSVQQEMYSETITKEH